MALSLRSISSLKSALQVLNAINKSGQLKYFLRDQNRRDKPKERIGNAHEKIFILVSSNPQTYPL